MEPNPFWLKKTQSRSNQQPSQKQLPPSHEAERTLEVRADAIKRPTGSLLKPPRLQREGDQQVTQNRQQQGESHFQNTLSKDAAITDQPTKQLQVIARDLEKQPAEDASIADINARYMPTMGQRPSQPLPGAPSNPLPHDLEGIETLRLPSIGQQSKQPMQAATGYHVQQKSKLTRRKAFLLIALLCMLLLQALQQGSQQISGSQGWAYILGGTDAQKTNLLSNVSNQLHGNNAKTTMTPGQYVDTIVQNMTLDQKLGQMMLVQFTGSDFGLDLNTMINQYNVGSVLLLAGNHNIVNKSQLTALTQQIQKNSPLPVAISLDQEGGEVDRLADLNGPRPSAAQIAATKDPTHARKAGEQATADLSQYGINLQLAPVVDVGTPYSVLQEQGRTFGTDADTVTKMAGAYLQGLQESGKVIGTLKHFPGLGSSSTDPHKGLPVLSRTQTQLDQIDWAPYQNLIKQGLVHAIMVTHEIVTAIDTTTPASLSSKLVTGVLRNQMGFQGVIMTDSLTMEGISAYYTTKQAAALAVEAGSDIIMGADSPSNVATMIEGIKEAISAGNINEQRINESVNRILMLKYQMGLLTLPKN